MLQIMTDDQVKDAKHEMIVWVNNHIRKNTFDVVYQVLYNLRQLFEELEDAKLTPEQRQKKAHKKLIKLGVIKK